MTTKETFFLHMAISEYSYIMLQELQLFISLV